MVVLVVELYIRGERSICKLVILHIKALKKILLPKPLKFLNWPHNNPHIKKMLSKPQVPCNNSYLAIGLKHRLHFCDN